MAQRVHRHALVDVQLIGLPPNPGIGSMPIHPFRHCVRQRTIFWIQRAHTDWRSSSVGREYSVPQTGFRRPVAAASWGGLRMHAFLSNNRDELIARCKAKVAQRPRRAATAEQLANGVPMFLEQLTRTLEAEVQGDAGKSLRISGASGGDAALLSEIGAVLPRMASGSSSWDSQSTRSCTTMVTCAKPSQTWQSSATRPFPSMNFAP